MSLYVSVGLGLVLEGSVGGWGGGGLVVGGGGGGGGDDGGVIYGSSMSVITPSPALLCAALIIFLFCEPVFLSTQNHYTPLFLVHPMSPQNINFPVLL